MPLALNTIMTKRMIWYVCPQGSAFPPRAAISHTLFFFLPTVLLYLQPVRRRRLSNDIFGHAGAATDAVAPGHAGHPFSGSMETRLGVMERVNSWLELHPDEEGQGEQQAPQGSSLRRLDRKNRYKVEVRFVQIKPNSTVPTIPTRSYRDSLRQVNRDYRGSGFTFRFVEAVAVVGGPVPGRSAGSGRRLKCRRPEIKTAPKGDGIES